MLSYVHLVGDHRSVQTFVEQQPGVLWYLLPVSKSPWL